MRTPLSRRWIRLALLATPLAACGEVGSPGLPVAGPGAASTASGTAAVLLADNRAMINPAALGGLDLSRDVWLAWDGNEYLSLFEQEAAYKGLIPAAHDRLLRRSDGWLETQAPVAGARFTAVQFNATGARVWAQLPIGWTGVSQTPARYECGHHINPGYSVSMHLPRAGYPAATYNSWITRRRMGDTTELFISKYLLPVDASQLRLAWRLVGTQIGWDWSVGISAQSWTAAGLTFRITGARNAGVANARAYSIVRTGWPYGSSVWARFGHLATYELDGYRHPLISLNCAQYPNYDPVGIILP